MHTLTHTRGDELLKQTTPLLTKQVCASQTAVAADTHKICDVSLQQVVRCTHAAFALPKVFTTSTSNNCSTLPAHMTKQG